MKYGLIPLFFKCRSKIRLTLSEAKELDSFLDDVQNKENGIEVAFILNKFFLDHAFLFCATANEVNISFSYPL